jgi:hypothetical protein
VGACYKIIHFVLAIAFKIVLNLKLKIYEVPQGFGSKLVCIDTAMDRARGTMLVSKRLHYLRFQGR